MARLLRNSAAAPLARDAYVGLGALLVVLAILLFFPAGSLDYWQAWVFLFVFGTPVALITGYFLRNDPKLIAARLRAGPAAETRTRQKVIQAFASLFFVVLVLVPALDHRFRWSEVPPFLAFAADAVVVIGLLVVFLVFRENSYTSAIIEVQNEQRVVTSGPYGVVRHPMYAGALLMLLAMPVALGSFVGGMFVLPMLVVIIWRLIDEESYLSKHLPGYDAYRRKTRYRLAAPMG